MQNQISKEQYRVAEQIHADRVRDYLEKAAKNPEMAAAATTLASAELGASGLLTVAAVVIWSKVNCDLTYTQSGRKITFAGTAFGIGFGGFVSGGGGPFAVPEFFVGSECHFELHGAAAGPGLVNCTWWNDRGAIGTFVAAGGGAFAGVVGGSGVWSYA